MTSIRAAIYARVSSEQQAADSKAELSGRTVRLRVIARWLGLKVGEPAQRAPTIIASYMVSLEHFNQAPGGSPCQ